MAFLFTPNKQGEPSKNHQFGIYIHFLGIMYASTNLFGEPHDF